MKIGYVIIAHNNPEQLASLVRALYQEQHYFFIHIDKSVEIEPFKKQLNSLKFNNIIFVTRVKSKWGSINLLNASLNGFMEALKYDIDFVVQLSGSDYPIKSNQYISDFFEKNKDTSFINYYKIPAPHWKPDKEISRIRKTYFYLGNKLFEYPMSMEGPSLKRKVLNIILSLFLPKVRRQPDNVVLYGGEFWFCLTKNACEEILKYSNKKPQLLQFLKYALSPDEIFYQTALLDSPNRELKIENKCLTHINWKNLNTPNPEYFTEEDFDKIASSDYLFARKFDFSKSPKLLDKINNLISKK